MESEQIKFSKKYHMRAIALSSCLLAGLSWATGAFAESQHITVNSQKATDTGNVVSLNITNKINVPLDKKKSYACTLLPKDKSATLGFKTLVRTPSASSVSADLIGDVTPQVATGISDASNKDNRITITPSESGEHSFALVQTGGDVVSTFNYAVECLETTLYSAYNTVVNDFNFLETENTSNQDLLVTVAFINFDDTFESPTAEVSYTVPSNGRVDRNVHGLVGDDKFGLVILTHNGPYGAIRGRVAQYVGTVESFNLSVTVPLASRESSL